MADKEDAIRLLIELGENGASTVKRNAGRFEPLLEKPGSGWGRSDLKEIGNRLTEADLALLIKGVVVAEKIGRDAITNRCGKASIKERFGFAWGGRGSTTPTQWLLPIYAKRFGMELADQLAEWCVVHATNPFIPFGSQHRHDALTLTDWHEWCEARPKREKRMNSMRKAQARLWRERRSSERLKIKIEKDKRRIQSLKKLRHLNPEEKLKFIANNDIDLESIPISLMPNSLHCVGQLDEATKHSIIQKIDKRTRGFWGRLKKRLLDPF